MMIDIKQHCTGRFAPVLISLGYPESRFTGKHGDCILCGDTNKNARWNAKKEYWVCTKCGVTQPMEMALEITGDTYKNTASRIRGNRIETMTTTLPNDTERNKKRIESILAGRQKLAGSQAEDYLIARGLKVIPERDVYFHPGVAYWHDGVASNFPAMVAVFRDAQGNGATLHITYLEGAGKAIVESPKKILPVAREMAGGAIRLFDVHEVMGIAEGIETALAVHEMEGIPVWSSSNAQMMKVIEIPESVKELNIYADNDKSFTGQEAAYVLAKRYAGKMIVKVHTNNEAHNWVTDTGKGGDFLEFLNFQRSIAK